KKVRALKTQGQILFDGKPVVGATIFLHPADGKEPPFPRPRAVTAQDGKFVLGTYRGDDGAPAGEYTLTVQWFCKVQGRGDALTNVLPGRYGAAATSGLKVRIENGDNNLPPFKLTR